MTKLNKANGSRRPGSAALCLWLLAMAIVSTGELLPGGSASLRWVASTGISDKVQHFVAYFLLATIPALSFQPFSGVLAGFSMIALGVLLEFLQRLIPGRDFELLDMAANAAGVLTGIALSLAFRKLPACSGDAPADRS